MLAGYIFYSFPNTHRWDRDILHKDEDYKRKMIKKFFFLRDQDGLIDMEDFLEGTPEEQADNLLQDGWGHLVLWPSAFDALIPSQTNPDQFYSAKLMTMECECPFPPFRGICVHLNLALILIQRKAKEEGRETIEMARARLAEEARENCDFLVERLSVTTFHSGIICVTSLSDFTCTCKASFFGCECVGVLLAKKLHQQTPLVTPVSGIDLSKQMMEYSVVSDPSNTITETTASVEPPSTTVDAENLILGATDTQLERSSKKLIEDLFLWSQSPQFVDSPQLHSALVKISAEIRTTPPAPEDKVARVKTRRNSSRDSPYDSSKRLGGSRGGSRESPRKSSRIKTVLHYK